MSDHKSETLKKVEQWLSFGAEDLRLACHAVWAIDIAEKVQEIIKKEVE